jgi:imidazolonepropionase-like amidohydrolase
MRRFSLVLFPLLSLACGASGTPRSPAAPSSSTAPLASATAPAPVPITPDTTLRYEIVFSERVAGGITLVHHGDGSYDTDYQFTDRGRGPKLHTHVEVGADLIPTRIETSGTDYLHAAVHELATCDSSRCQWDSTTEHGAGGRGFYAALYGGAPDELTLRAIQKSGGTLTLLPGGSIRARRIADATVERGAERRHVVAWEFSGFGLTPSVSWYDDDGAWFGEVEDGAHTLLEGWGAAAPTLLAVQRPLDAARRERLAKELVHHPDKGLAIVHARLFDPVAKRLIEDATITIVGDRVKSVAAKGKAPAGYEVIDAKGKVVLPGLWDMHVHAGDDDGLLQIAEGVTTVRDLGNETESSLARRAKWDEGKEIGPHLLLAGMIDTPGEYQVPFGSYVSTEAEAKAAVDAYAAKGYVQIKMYSSLKPELVPVIAKEAHAKGLRVSGHVPHGLIAEDAVNQGFDELQHINFLVLDLVADRATETQTPLRLSIPAEHAADIDLDAPKTKALLDLLVKKKTVIDPTLSVFEDDLTTRPDHPSQVMAPVLDQLPVNVRRGATQGGLPVPEGKEAAFQESWKRMKQLTKRLWDRHIPIVAGTDNFPGLALHRELEIYSEIGIPNADVLAIATIGAARVMGRDKTSGSVAPGKDADLIVIDGDPLKSMRDVRNVVTVVKGGVVTDARAAQAALSITAPGAK